METFTAENEPQKSRQNDAKFNPFPGLRPFSTEESHLFFGREGQSQEVLKLLAKNKFVGLLGTSGSGKSSLMYCGVIPILQGGFITKAGTDWKIITCRPGQSPIKNLANSLTTYFKQEQGNSAFTGNTIEANLLASSMGLVETLKMVPRNESQNLLLLVDQFEELFRFRKIKNTEEAYNEVMAYIRLLLELQSQSEIPAYIVITMRSDFIGECAQFQELTQLINDSHYLIPQMTRKDFREAIEGPIAVGGGKITPFLVQQLLNDIGDNPDQLPILQHALMRTWDAWIKSGNTHDPIDIKEYESIGKLEKALSEHANEAYNELTQPQKEICQSIFKTITEKGGDNRGVRRPTSIAEIAEIANTNAEQIIVIVDHFRQPGRSFLAPAPPAILNSESIIDISHESIMRIWDKLIVWVSEEYEAVQMYKRLSQSALKFQVGETGLWRPPDLLLALSWRDKQKPTLTWARRHSQAFERAMVFLETSHKEFKLEEENKIRQQKRTLRRSKVFAIVLGTASIISLIFMIQAFLNKQEADKQTILAQEQTIVAQQQTEEAKKQQQIALEQKQKALESEQEALKQKDLADTEKKRAEASAYVAQKQEKIATQKSIEASEQRRNAEINLEESKRQQQIAEEASLRAQKLRMLSISQSMAVKSLQIDIDTVLRGLVAYQAYLFNKDFDGNTFNPDIYNGLYYAHKNFYGNKATDYPAHTYQIRGLASTDNSKRMYSTGSDGKIMTINLSKPQDTSLFYNTNAINRCLILSADEQILIVGLNNGDLLRFNTNALPIKPQLIHSFESQVNGAIFTNNQTLIAFDNSGALIRYDLLANSVETIESPLKIKDIIKNNNSYYATTISGQMHIIESFSPLKYETLALNYSNDGKSGMLTKDLSKSQTGIISSLAVSADNKFLAIGDLNGNILVFNHDNFNFLYRLIGHTARINSIKFDSDNKYLASASNDGSILLWVTTDFNFAPYRFTDNQAWVMLIQFVNNNTELMAGYADGKLRKWPVEYLTMAQKINEKITRNFTPEEWQQYVAKDIEYQKTLKQLP